MFNIYRESGSIEWKSGSGSSIKPRGYIGMCSNPTHSQFIVEILCFIYLYIYTYFRFIDDLIALNDDGEFSKSFREIYPHEMEFKRENYEDNAASYLDLGLEIEDKQVSSNLYDKRNDFNFSIVRFTYRSSNIP